MRDSTMNTSLTIRKIDMTNNSTVDYLFALDMFIGDMIFMNMPFEEGGKFIPSNNPFDLYMKSMLKNNVSRETSGAV